MVKPGEFTFNAAHHDHGHIYGQCNGLTEAGAELKWVYEPDPKKLAAFREEFPPDAGGPLGRRNPRPIPRRPPGGRGGRALRPRPPEGCRVMAAGKDYFTDKTPLTALDQLDQARAAVIATRRKYMVYFSERLHVESAMFATDLVQQGAVGRVVQVLGLGPHRLSKDSRPAWFFERAKFGGILCDIGSHQFEQFLTYSGATDAVVNHAAVGNFANPDKPEFEDFGEANLLGNNGATNYIRVDWFTPDGLSTWGDGRTIILGTDGYIELRKYVDVAREAAGDHVYLVDEKGEGITSPVAGQVGFRFFGEFILDSINRTERAMTQAHAFKAAELCRLRASRRPPSGSRAEPRPLELSRPARETRARRGCSTGSAVPKDHPPRRSGGGGRLRRAQCRPGRGC